MSSLVFDAGDMDRLDREARLTEQRPRQPIEEDRSPSVMEDEFISAPAGSEQDDQEDQQGYDMLLDGVIEALQRRLL